MSRSSSLGCLMLAAGFAVLFTAGCHVEGPMAGPPPVTCSGAADAFSCTDDFCPSGGGVYVQVPVHARCGAGGSCRPDLPGHDAAGCVGGSPPPTCPTSCDDSIGCTRDFCASDLTCQHVPLDTECGAGERCAPSETTDPSGCFEPDGPPPPPTGFHCVWTEGANRLAYAVRMRATEMTGVRTIPSSTGTTSAMSASHIRLWALGTGAAIDSDASGWVTYSLIATPGGRINTHPFINTWRIGDPAYDLDILNIADLRSFVGRTCREVGLELEACVNPSGCARDSDWVDAPEAFCRIEADTVSRRFWTDPAIAPELRGTVVIRAVISTNGSDDTAMCRPVSL